MPTLSSYCPANIASLLSLGLVFTCSPPSSLVLFTLAVFTLSKAAYVSSPQLGLLVLLIYIGSLIILFAYLWIFIPSSLVGSLFWPSSFFLVLLVSSSTVAVPASFCFFVIPSSFFVFLVTFLFWVMIVVVTILDLSLGGFSA